MNDKIPDSYPLTLIADAQAKEGWTVHTGETVYYLGHVPGGMIRVRTTDGKEGVIHPHATKELRT